MSELILNDDELNKISKESRERKFDGDKNLLYKDEPLEIFKVFIDSYKFILNLSNNLKNLDEEISNKFKNYCLEYESLFNESVRLSYLLSRSLNFNRHLIERKIFNLFNDNKKEIFDFINSIHPIGKRVFIYDPDKNAGISK